MALNMEFLCSVRVVVVVFIRSSSGGYRGGEVVPLLCIFNGRGEGCVMDSKGNRGGGNTFVSHSLIFIPPIVLYLLIIVITF